MGLRAFVYVWVKPAAVKVAAARVHDMTTLEHVDGSTVQQSSLGQACEQVAFLPEKAE